MKWECRGWHGGGEGGSEQHLFFLAALPGLWDLCSATRD